jgi:hypothetical protein
VCCIMLFTCCESNETKSGWFQKKSPSTSIATYTFTADNKIYIASFNVTTNKLDWFKYSPASDAWTQEVGFPLSENRYYTMSASDNRSKAYAGLGFSIEELPTGQRNILINKDVWEFDATLKQWSRLPDFPGKNQFSFDQPPAAFLLDETLFVISSGYSECWALNLTDRRWTERSIPVLSAEHKGKLAKGFSHDGSGYILLGESSYPIDELLIYNYSPKEDKWSIVFVAEIAQNLREEALFILYDKLYLGGSLWKKYDLKTMSDLGYFAGKPDTTFNRRPFGVVGYSIDNTGFVLFTNREFWQYIP